MANGSVIVNNGKKIILNRAYKGTPDYNEPNQFKVGVNSGTPLVSDTDLDRPIPINSTESVDDCETADWTDSADMTSTLNSTTFKEGSNALNLTKDGTTSATATVNKTTTSLDFTSKDFWMWLYIKDTTTYNLMATTDCVTIRFGSDSSNYYVFTRDKADLAVGWNYITFNTSTADSTTGSPVITACDYTYIGITATASGDTWVAGDLIMDDLKLASASDYFSSIDTGYPSFDETNHEVEIQSTLSMTDANGYQIDGFSLWNDDSTELMHSKETFTDESKSNTDEFVFITVDRIE